MLNQNKIARMQHCRRLAAKVIALKQSPSFIPLPSVHPFYSEIASGRQPVMYTSGIVILFQGRKVGYLGETLFHYDANSYLMVTVTLPFECETFASKEEPIAGVLLSCCPRQIQQLVMEMESEPLNVPELQSAVHTAELTDPMLNALERLLDSMVTPQDARVLGNNILREIFYYVLQGPCRDALLLQAHQQPQFMQLSRVLKRIESHYNESFSVESMAYEANMSVSAFHHHFKQLTSTSPLQYLKHVRLHKARLLMQQEGMRVSTAAVNVGYESPSQFSREFKRYFGLPPVAEVMRLRHSE
ncbi:MAG: RCS-specific HTH-type transcriptional activator RclR [Candidatus Erwinia impunctatus]